MKQFGHSNGELNTALHQTAVETLTQLGAIIQETCIDAGYDVKSELAKFIWADLIIYQMPGWWMGPPWIFKKYMDLIFTEGHGTLYSSDGRSRHDNSKKYGSGGLVQNKRYMLSVTWNAPDEAFTDPEQFFNGIGIDGVYLSVHKAHQFLGMRAFKTFLCTDVMKATDFPQYKKRYIDHLKDIMIAEV